MKNFKPQILVLFLHNELNKVNYQLSNISEDSLSLVQHKYHIKELKNLCCSKSSKLSENLISRKKALVEMLMLPILDRARMDSQFFTEFTFDSIYSFVYSTILEDFLKYLEQNEIYELCSPVLDLIKNLKQVSTNAA